MAKTRDFSNMWIYEAHILLYIFLYFLNYICTSFNCLIGSSLLANNSTILGTSMVLSQIKVLLYLVSKPGVFDDVTKFMDTSSNFWVVYCFASFHHLKRIVSNCLWPWYFKAKMVWWQCNGNYYHAKITNSCNNQREWSI